MADASRTIAKGELTRLLAAALGREKADELLAAAAGALGLSAGPYSLEEARALFARLARTEGLIGVVARFALSRGDVDALARDAASPAEAPSVGAVDLLDLLAPSLGIEKARDATAAAAARLGLDAKNLSPDEAMKVLDELAREGGIVGVVARFAKARVALGSAG